MSTNAEATHQTGAGARGAVAGEAPANGAPRRRIPVPIACTLDAEGAQRQAGEWDALRDDILERRSLDDGLRVWFPASREAEVRDLAAREASCCGFLQLAVTADGGRVRLDVTSPQPDARPVIEALVGSPG